MLDHRPGCGGGSCRRCGASLGLAAVRADGVWYCTPTCAQGRPAARPRPPAVPEPWLYGRPRRFFRARKPKELKSTRAGS